MEQCKTMPGQKSLPCLPPLLVTTRYFGHVLANWKFIESPCKPPLFGNWRCVPNQSIVGTFVAMTPSNAIVLSRNGH
eukprot:1474040-Amphidinium_carterae.1